MLQVPQEAFQNCKKYMAAEIEADEHNDRKYHFYNCQAVSFYIGSGAGTPIWHAMGSFTQILPRGVAVRVTMGQFLVAEEWDELELKSKTLL